MILVTRPAPAGIELAAQLQARARSVRWWPAFDLLGPREPRRLRGVIDGLAQFDLVVFVSPAAVHGFAAAAGAAVWPAATVLAGVGRATLQAALCLPGAATAHCVAPDGPAAADGGSEALWEALAALQPVPRRALLVRAQSGRPWLARRLAQSGVAVEEVEAYQRLVHTPAPDDWAALHAAHVRGERLAVLFTSSEAVDTITTGLRHDAALLDWVAAGIGLAVHPRIAQALRAAGWRDVRDCAATAASVEMVLAGEGAALGAAALQAPAGGIAGIS